MEDDAGMYGEFGQPLEAVASGSKRKRTLEWTMTVPEADVRLADAEEQVDDLDKDEDGRQTPKRSRSSPPKGEQRSVRRKHARYGLSSLNKRHAVEPEPQEHHSRFQEGSMSDKPSMQPPSVFTRDTSNPRLPALANVDHLMSQYHDGHMSQSVDLDRTVEPLMEPAVAAAVKDSVRPASLFRFGRMFASSFNPASVWESFSRTWRESKEDLTVRNIEENRLRRAQEDREFYEQKYQEFKKSGQFAFTVVPNKALTSPRMDREQLGLASPLTSPRRQPVTSPRHGAFHHHHGHVTASHSRDVSMDSAADTAPPPQLAALFNRDRGDSPAPEHQYSPEKPLKPRKSFFSLRAPSMSSLRRGRSDFNLSTAFARNSSSSVSPEKTPYQFTLTKSQSKRDLNKQVKLSKRVSNLEAKLADARRDLNHAITNASPLPPLPSRFEKFTPTSKFSKSRFGIGSGKLPSLPSENLLSPGNPVQDTPTLPRPRPRPQHSQSFDLSYFRDSAVVIDHSHSKNSRAPSSIAPSDYSAPMDPATLLSSDPLEQAEDGVENRPSLDARLKALDATVKSKSKKPAASKKRKSNSKDDQAYRPDPADDEDDAEFGFVKEKPKKKRKSIGKKTPSVEPATQKPVIEVSADESDEASTKQAEVPQQEDERPQTGRSSLESLDPIYEEEVIVMAPRPTSKHDSGVSNVDAESLHSREASKSIRPIATRTRSKSPNKRPSSQRRNTSPSATNYSKPTVVVEDYVVSITPGVGNVPAMPAAAKEKHACAGAERPSTSSTRPGSSATQKEQWDWPEDVF